MKNKFSRKNVGSNTFVRKTPFKIMKNNGLYEEIYSNLSLYVKIIFQTRLSSAEVVMQTRLNSQNPWFLMKNKVYPQNVA